MTKEDRILALLNTRIASQKLKEYDLYTKFPDTFTYDHSLHCNPNVNLDLGTAMIALERAIEILEKQP